MVTLVDPVAGTPAIGLVVLAQSTDPAAGTLLQYVGTFVTTLLFAAITAHVASKFVLGGTPVKLAFAVAVLPALAVTLLIRQPPPVTLLTVLILDVVGFHLLYRVRLRTAVICAVMHVTIVIILSVALGGILSLVMA